MANSISRLLLPLDGAYAACCEQMAIAMANSERAALEGLRMCIDTIMAEVSLHFSSLAFALILIKGLSPDVTATEASI